MVKVKLNENWNYGIKEYKSGDIVELEQADFDKISKVVKMEIIKEKEDKK
jgi:hypothetical protein